MNRHNRRIYLASLDQIVTNIQREPTWKGRWAAFCFASRRPEVGADLARHIIDGLASPTITEISQCLLYAVSSAPAHQVAAQAWCQHSNIPLFQDIKRGSPTEAYLKAVDSGELPRLISLYHTLLMIATRDETPPWVIAFRNLMRDLARQYRLSQLRSRDGTTIPRTDDADTEMIDTAALYLTGELIPADAGTELALQDAMERLHQDHGDVLQPLLVLSGWK